MPGRADPRILARLAGRAVFSSVVLAALVTGLLAAILVLGGYDPVRGIGALWSGAFGSAHAFASTTLVRATPLILTGAAVALAFRAGVWNIGAEGQLLFGATVGVVAGLQLGPGLGGAVIPVMLLAGAVAGGLWAGIAAVMRWRFGVLEVISTIMLNFVALSLVSWLVRGPLQEPRGIYPQTPSLPDAVQLPTLVEGSRLHWGFPITILVCMALAWILRSTAAGFRLRASGANPAAAASAGRIDVARTTAFALIASGAVAGLAGAVEVSGVTYALYENISPGYGYTAIAVALLARLDPLRAIASGLLFGALEAGAGAMQRDAGVPSVIVTVVVAILILGVLGAERVRSGGPAGWMGVVSGRRSAAERGT